MAFLVDDGTGLENANSYATVEAFKEYLGDRGRDIAGLADEKIQQLLIRGSFALDNTYSQRWRGDRASYTQGLDFPRTGAEFNDGTAIAGIPRVVKFAAIEFAYRENSSAVVPDKRTDPSVKRVKSRVDVVEESIEYFKVGEGVEVDSYPEITGLLSDVIRGGATGGSGEMLGTPRAGGLLEQEVCDRVRDDNKYPVSFYNGQFENDGDSPEDCRRRRGC